MKKRQIWQWRKNFQINGKWQSMGGLAQGSSLGSKRKEWWQKRILQFEKRNERENGNIFSLWLVAAVNLNGGKYMWLIYMANIWQYILAGCRLPWMVGFGEKYARLQFYLHPMQCIPISCFWREEKLVFWQNCQILLHRKYQAAAAAAHSWQRGCTFEEDCSNCCIWLSNISTLNHALQCDCWILVQRQVKRKEL